MVQTTVELQLYFQFYDFTFIFYYYSSIINDDQVLNKSISLYLLKKYWDVIESDFERNFSIKL